MDFSKIDELLTAMIAHITEHKKLHARSQNIHDHERFMLVMRGFIDDYENAVDPEPEISDNNDDSESDKSDDAKSHDSSARSSETSESEDRDE